MIFFQFWDILNPKENKESNAMETDAGKASLSEMNENDKSDCSVMECEMVGEFAKTEEETQPPESTFQYKDGSKVILKVVVFLIIKELEQTNFSLKSKILAMASLCT